MNSKKLMSLFVKMSFGLLAAFCIQSFLFLKKLPPSPGVAEIFYYLRMDQLLLTLIFSFMMLRVQKHWEEGSRKGGMFLQVYTLLLVMYAFEHGRLFRLGSGGMHLGYAIFLGAVALAGMLAYYMKQREHYRKE